LILSNKILINILKECKPKYLKLDFKSFKQFLILQTSPEDVRLLLSTLNTDIDHVDDNALSTLITLKSSNEQAETFWSNIERLDIDIDQIGNRLSSLIIKCPKLKHISIAFNMPSYPN